MPILKHCILQTILNVFLLFIFVWNKIFISKTEPRFVWLGLGWYFVLQYEKLCISGALFVRLWEIKDSLATIGIICWE